MRSQTWTPLPPPSPQHLSGSYPCTSPKHAAPYVRHGLAIQFLHDSIHVRIPILPNHPTLSLINYSVLSFLYISTITSIYDHWKHHSKVKEESEKVGLKLNIQKTKIMASGPITLWQIDGETMEIVTDFIFLGSKITADDDCNHEIKRCLLLGRKAMTNLDSILKSRDITNKGPSSQSCGFSRSHVWMWELEHKEG